MKRRIADSSSRAFWKLRALCARGRAREIGAHYDRRGRKLVAFEPYGAPIRRNPDSGETFEGSVTIGQEYFSAALREYTNWRLKWWREALQNSVDAGASTITCTITQRQDGHFEVAVEDDGSGMDRDTLLTKFLVLGGTTKKEGSSSTGGFGEAKKLLILPWISWEIETRETRAFGQNIRYKYQILDRPRRGTMLRVVMPKDNATSEADALAFIKRCTLPGIGFSVNGKAVRADHRPGKEVHAPELEAVGGKLKVFHNPSAEGPGIWIRKGGLFMFEKWASSELKGVVTAEIQVPSTQVLTANRDGFSDWKTQQGLDDFANKLAADVLSVLKRKKGIIRKKYIGTGKFRSGAIRAAILDSLQKHPIEGKGADDDDKRMATELVEIVTTIRAPGPAEGVEGVEGSAPRGAPAGPLEPVALLAMLEGLELKGASVDKLEAVAKQLSWEPDFFLVNEIDGFFVPAKFKPETMAPTIRKLARFWADLIRFVLMQMGSIEEYGIGFVFDTDKLGAYMQEESGAGGEEKWVLLNPYREAKVEGGEVYSLAKKRDVAELYAIAVHECTHLANRLPQHNEAFASAFTKNVALTAGKDRAINAIRKAVTARGAPARAAATNPLMHIIGAGAHLLPFVNPPLACVFCDRTAGLVPVPGAPGRHQCADASACARRARRLLAKEARTANAAGLPWNLKRTAEVTANAKLVWAPIALVMAAADRGQRLDLATGEGETAVAWRLAGALAHFRAGLPMTPPTIMVYPERERSGVVFQDGRHRLVAAWQLGARWAPFWLAGGAKRLERVLRGAGRAEGNPPRPRGSSPRCGLQRCGCRRKHAKASRVVAGVKP